jgi:signal transduction histidine kinase
LAHELRNPLMAMRLLVEAGGDQSGSGEGLDPRDLQVLDEEIARLEKLVESFLDFARPPQPEKTTIDARILLQQTLHLLGGPARQRDVTIDWQPPVEAVTIEADPVQLRQVLLNLLLNALEATSDGGTVTVELGSGRNLPEAALGRHGSAERLALDHYVAIHVCDQGPGVPDQIKQSIFEPFVSGKKAGMGMGLAVCRRIAEAHGGAITVTDNPGGGARFTLCIPRSGRRPRRPPHKVPASPDLTADAMPCQRS